MASYRNCGTRTLSDSHQREIRAAGISAEVEQARGYKTIHRRAEIPDTFADWQRRLGLLIPTYSPSGSVDYQLKPTRPIKRRNGDAPKYEQPHGSSLSLDVNPLMLCEVREGTSDLWISEGSKKIDSLASRGEAGVGIIGVWCYAVPKTHSQIPLEDWKHVRLEGRRVIIVYDADAKTNYSVQLALQRLVAMLEKLGAEVLVTYIPPVEDDPKAGVDDYLGAGGSLEELRQAARPFEPTDIVRERMSRDDRLRAGVEDLYNKLWDTPWSGMAGASARDVYQKIIEQAERKGKLHPGGLRVVMAQGPLALSTKLSSRTVTKSINRLEAMGILYRDNSDREAHQAGAFILPCSTRASVKYMGSKSPSPSPAPAQKEDCNSPVTSSNLPTLHLRAPVEIPRLRWPQPGYAPRRGLVKGSRKVRESKPQEPRPAIKRLGKTRGHIIDALAASGGTLTVQELARILHKRRPRDLRRRNLPMLEECGIVVLSEGGDSVSLTENWREALEAERRRGKETDYLLELEREDGHTVRITVLGAETVASRRYRQKSYAFHHRGEEQESRPSKAAEENIRRSREAREAGIREAHEREKNKPPPVYELIEEQAQRFHRLVREGMGERWALREVLGDAGGPVGFPRVQDPPPEPEPEVHPLACECLECSCRAPRYAKAWSAA
jgi:hypothetical protein